VFDTICLEYSSDKAKAESKRERAEMGVLLQNNLTYGEVHFQSIAECFCYIQNKYGAFKEPGGTFIDLGSVSLYLFYTTIGGGKRCSHRSAGPPVRQMRRHRAARRTL
jgi:hypothetical protein